jgi:uncharacterized membrane protein
MSRLLYLDWLRGIAVLVMIHAHVIDSWTREADRDNETFYTLLWIGGLASTLFLFLAGVALGMSANVRARQLGSVSAGARAVRQRGWEVFVLSLLFRLQAMVLGFGHPQGLLKVDMLNVMGLAMVAASYLWPMSSNRTARAILFGLAAAALSMATPLVRVVAWLAPLPDPIEAYLRPAGNYSGFAMFPWAGFLFGGVLVGDLVDAVRMSGRRPVVLQAALLICGSAAVALAWLASFRPALFPTARFWHDSPTLFFMRFGFVTAMVAVSWLVERTAERAAVLQRTVLLPLVTLGRSSLFVYWFHIEFVYGLIAEPIKRTLPLWASELGWILMCVAFYRIVLWKNRWMETHELPARWKILAPVLR